MFFEYVMLVFKSDQKFYYASGMHVIMHSKLKMLFALSQNNRFISPDILLSIEEVRVF